MKILFLVYHGFSDASGISKKIHSQVKGLRENGHEVHLCYYDVRPVGGDVRPDGHWCRYVDGEVLSDFGTGFMAGLRQRMCYADVLRYCRERGIQMVYARCFQNASPWLIRFFRGLRKAGIRAVTEIPTYPYDQEFQGFQWKMRVGLKCDQLFRHSLYRQMDGVVTFSNADRIFGQRTIRISNGVDFDGIPLHRFQPVDDAVHLIGVAEVHYWHGFDRVVAGLGEYYRTHSGGRRVVFHVVGGVYPSYMDGTPLAPGFRGLIEKYGLQDAVVFHGQLFGEALDRVFNQCQFAIGSLGRHRSGITHIKTLKNREYATRGVPFVYSEQDEDFDQQPYVLKAPADETPLDIDSVLHFLEQQPLRPEEIRKTVEHLSWKVQMQRVVEAAGA